MILNGHAAVRPGGRGAAPGIARSLCAAAVLVGMHLGGTAAWAQIQAQDQTEAQSEPQIEAPAPADARAGLPQETPAPGRPMDRMAPRSLAILQGLDKTTARVSTFEAPIDGVARFGTLQITARACMKKPPTEPPESTAFLEIVDIRPDSPSVELFSGWMFASSPAISALEHPVYDVWVIGCRQGGAADETAAGPAGPEPRQGDQAADTGEFPEDPEGEALPEGEAPPVSQ